jgi:hypothetical protein
MTDDTPTVSPRSRRLPSRLATLAATAMALSACRREEVTHVRVPKSAPAPAGPAAPPGPGEVAPPPSPSGSGALRWTLPRGWTESLVGGMRYATLTPSVKGKVDVSVVVLPGPAGGELPNVNRWRGQIGLPPVDQAALASARRTLKTRAGPLSLYDFASQGEPRSRMIVGLLSSGDGNTWFVKMSGDAKPVGDARKAFLELLETLRFD